MYLWLREKDIKEKYECVKCDCALVWARASCTSISPMEWHIHKCRHTLSETLDGIAAFTLYDIVRVYEHCVCVSVWMRSQMILNLRLCRVHIHLYSNTILVLHLSIYNFIWFSIKLYSFAFSFIAWISSENSSSVWWAVAVSLLGTGPVVSWAFAPAFL